METLYFIVAAAVLYFIADRVLDFLERRAGRRFEYRTIVFFVLVLASALAAFWIIQRVAAGST
jgi:predicted PurR-regulated permease PerM